MLQMLHECQGNRRDRRRKSLTWLCLPFVCSAPAWPGEDPGAALRSVTGTVRTKSGVPIPQAVVHARLGRKPDAKRVRVDAADLSPELWAQAHYATGFTHDQLNHRAQAVACYEQALDLVEPESKLHPELQKGLDRKTERLVYVPVKRH